MSHNDVFTPEQLALFEANLIKDIETNKDLKPISDDASVYCLERIESESPQLSAS